MTNSVWVRSAVCLALPLLAPAGCGNVSSAARLSEPGGVGLSEPSGTVSESAGIALAPGAGRDLLLRACTACHDLQALEAFKGYYDRPQWHALVLTMVDHGAVLEAPEVEAVTDYLVGHFGPGTR